MNDINFLDSSIIFNNKVNFDVAKEKGLIVENDARAYSIIQGFYVKAFESLLTSKVNLKEYDDILKNSDLDFRVVSDDIKLEYHKLSSMNLSYIYIRNFFFIEKLEDADLSYFANKINQGDYSIDDKTLSIVEKSFRDVIVDNFRNPRYVDRDTVISYGPHSEINDCIADALCVFIHYGKNSSDLSKDEFFENKRKKEELLNEISDKIASEISTKMNVKVVVKIRRILAA